MEIINKEETLIILNISENELDILVKNGLKCFLFDNEIRFDKKEILKYLLNQLNEKEIKETQFFKENNISREYVSIEEFSSLFKLDINFIRNLCMDNKIKFISFDDKYYIKTNDFFNESNPNETVLTSEKNEEETVFIVDGSLSKFGFCCSGIVLKNKKETLCFSKSHLAQHNNSVLAELIAIYDALTYAKENNISNFKIATDQVNLIKKYNSKDFTLSAWQKYKKVKSISQKIHYELKKADIEFLYANTADFYNEYNYAHALSRTYSNSEIEKINENLLLNADKPIEKDVIFTNLHNEIDSFTKIPFNENDFFEKKITINFSHMNNNFVYFDIFNSQKNKTEVVKINGKYPSKAALILSNNYAEAAFNKGESLSIELKKIVSLDRDLNIIKNKPSEIKKYVKFLNEVNYKCSFITEDNLNEKIKEITVS